MTRLTQGDIFAETHALLAYEQLFQWQTGSTMLAVAQRAMEVERLPAACKIAVIPVTSGEGVIGGFSQALVRIFRHCNFEAYITEKTDLGGVLEAQTQNADMIIMADDDCYLMFNVGCKGYAENGYCTGRVFAQALYEGMGQPQAPKSVLVLGAGPVGESAAQRLLELGQAPVIYDIDSEKARLTAARVHCPWVEGDMAYHGYHGVVDATTAGGFIGLEDLDQGVVVSAPGVPLGVRPEVADAIPVIHNTLELGTLAMLCQCVHMQEVEHG
ncbi:3-methylornithyl-N6-L-lysine dehydrogenase PylD [Bengtsoniella intestinalis]|uniref:3-methylornithyl-N6-L-lysine dehydrogenase PylD n=1 Tax=Bengtsoniella intestinalis TaxID=3073143 RepID=UPI00391F980E